MRQNVYLVEKHIPLRLNFEGVEVEKFIVVKKYLGLMQNTEVVRALLSEKYNEIQRLEQKRRDQQLKEAKAMEWLEKGEYNCPM